MRSVPGIHVISYSSYPEIPNSPTVHEISKVNRFSEDADPKPLALIKVHGDTVGDIEVIPANSDAYLEQKSDEKLGGFLVSPEKSQYESENPFEINGVRSPLSPSEIGMLTRTSRNLEEVLGYSVNTESKLPREDYDFETHLLQLRPVPIIEDFSPLAEPDRSQKVIAETPFVYGVFNYTAPVILTEDKNIARGGISIPKPVIVWDSERHKGHRLFWGNQGDNCLALINPEEGRTLSHEMNIFPRFGESRDRFHAIGAPQLSSLFEKLELRRYPCLRRECAGRFGETPFPITIESDGRHGRVSISIKDLESYEKQEGDYAKSLL